MTKHKLILALLITSALAANGCSEFEIQNDAPIAQAQVLVNGMVANLEEPLPYAGMPLAITLDGSMSSDKDGDIASFLWLQTDVSNAERYAGNGLVDSGALPMYAGDPMPVAQPQLSLGEGSYQFTLWVTDDDKMTSTPATVAFTIETPTSYMPDPTCAMNYVSMVEGCSDCVCTPTAMMGCLDNYTACYANADPMFVTLCKAVVDCALAVPCSGQACYTGGCMAEIDAAAAYMGGTLASCQGDAAANPCAAASQLGACTSTGTCMAACN